METLLHQHKATEWVKQLPSSNVLLDNKLQIIDASPNWFKIFGLERKALLGKAFLDIFPNLNDTWEDSLEYALDGLTDIKIKDSFHLDNAPQIDLVWTLNPWKDGYGKSIGVILNTTRVLKKKIEKKPLYQSNSSIPAHDPFHTCSWEYHVLQGTVYWSKELKELLGLPHDYLPQRAKSLSFISNPKEKALFKTAVVKAMHSGKPWQQTVNIFTTKQTSVRVSISGRPKFRDGKCTRIIGSVEALENHVYPNGRPDLEKIDTTLFQNIDLFPTAAVLFRPSYRYAWPHQQGHVRSFGPTRI